MVAWCFGTMRVSLRREGFSPSNSADPEGRRILPLVAEKWTRHALIRPGQRILRAIPLAALLSFVNAMTHTTEAQEGSPTAAAEAVVRTVFEELDARRWSTAAALVHPATLERFRARQLQNARSWERYQNEPQRYDPEMPPEVVAWFEKRRQELEEHWGTPAHYAFARVASIEELEALSAEELFVRHLQWLDPREQLDRGLAVDGSPALPEEETREMVEELRPQRTVVGAVLEDDSTVHVVYRTRIRGAPGRHGGSPAVVTVRRTPEGWRLWTGSADGVLFGDDPTMGFGFYIDYEERERFRELAEKGVTWPLEGGGEGRAFVSGDPGGTIPPKALVIEVVRHDGTKDRVEVPAEALPRLVELIRGLFPTPESP